MEHLISHYSEYGLHLIVNMINHYCEYGLHLTVNMITITVSMVYI